MPNRFEQYLTLAGEQIRWKRARPRLLSELRTHLLDERDGCLARGMTEEAAQAEAIRQMGDPVLVGQSLDAVHRPKPQWGLLTLSLLLAATGVVLRIWLTAGWANGGSAPVWSITALCLGVAALLGAYLLDVSWLGRHGKGIFLGVLCLGLLFFALHRAFWSGSFSYPVAGMQCLMMCVPLAFGLCLYSCRGQGWKGVCLPLLGLAAVSLLSVACHQLLVAPFVWLVGLVLLWVLAGQDWFSLGKRTTRAVALGVLLALLAAGFLALQNDYIATRLSVALHPGQDPMGAGYTGLVLQQALEGAQWIGEGEYNLPVVQGADTYFLTTILQKLGWFPVLAIVLAMGGALTWMLVRGLRQRNSLGKITVLSVTVSLLFRLVLGLSSLGFPLWGAGIPLFFTSTGAAVDLALLGFALSALRQEQLPTADPAPLRIPETE